MNKPHNPTAFPPVTDIRETVARAIYDIDEAISYGDRSSAAMITANRVFVSLLVGAVLVVLTLLVIDNLNPLTKTEIRQGDTCLILETYRVVGPTVYFC